MEKLANISKFEALINESNRVPIENGFGWNRIKKAAIPLVTSTALHGIPNAMNMNTILAPETPKAAQISFASPEVQEAAEELRLADSPLGPNGMDYFLISHFGSDRRNLSEEDLEMLRGADEECKRRLQTRKEQEERQAKHAQEEKELEEIYSGKKTIPP